MQNSHDNQQQSSEEQLSGKELYEMRKKERLKARGTTVSKETLQGTSRKIGRYILYVVAAVAVIGGLGWFLITRPFLPPITDANHIEASPPAHIVTQPIPDNIQRHMLEHADGRGKPGVIIQYNCDDFDCGSDLVQKLTNLVERYPDNVYLGPNNYDGKIIMTKLGKRAILGGFNEDVIKNFIEEG